MKKIITLFVLGFLTFTMNAQEKQVTEKPKDPNAPVFEFVTEVIDYGKIALNADGVRTFKFKNVGKSPLVINDIKSSCGCTVPKKPDAPIMPGDSGEIEVKYDTNRPGGFSKSITVASNADEPVKMLQIKGIVLK
ncbi:MAG: DUF1573 domain-containing protein [Gelidibacter sp.]|nr:DUF1573 domain-containing protein [Gelidibacter sp.]